MSAPAPTSMPPASPLTRAALGLAAAAFIVPLLVPVHAPPILSFYDEWLGAALLLAASLVATAARGTFWSLPTCAPWLLALAGVFALHAPSAVYPQVALGWAVYAFLVVLAAMMARRLANECGEERVACAFAIAIALAGVANVVIALIQLVGVPAALQDIVGASAPGRAVGHIAQPNLFATVLALAMASVLYLRSIGRIGVPVAIVLIVVLAYGAALTGSRLAIVHVVWLTLIASIVRRGFLAGAIGALLAVVALQLAVAPLHAALGWPVPLTGIDRAQALAAVDGTALGIASRLELWRTTLALALDSPWIGTGPGLLAADLFARGLPDVLAREGEVWTSSHNVLLDVFAAGGATALVAVLAALALWWLPVLRTLLRAPRVAVVWAAMSVGVILLHALAETPHLYAQVLAMLGLAMGCVAAAPPARAGLALRGGVAVLALCIAVVAVRVLIDYQALDRVRHSQQATFLGEADRAADRATLQALGEGPLAPIADLVRFLGVPVRESDAAEHLALGARVVQFRPAAAVVVRQAALLALAGFGDQADALIDHLVAQRPWRRAAIAATLAAFEDTPSEALDALRARVLADASPVPRRQ